MRPERVKGPKRCVSCGNHIGVAVETESSGCAFLAKPGDEIGNAGTICSETNEPGLGQKTLQKFYGATLFRGDRTAADQPRGEVNRVGSSWPMAIASAAALQ